jgi:23S rRNA (adenine2030-N6)-methyltransferase
MLSYRHAFHAGNAADVLKHSVLIQCLDYIGQKEKGFTYIDTHAGAGLYRLNEGYAAQNKEWLSGTEKVIRKIDDLHAANNDDEKSQCELLNRYNEIILPFWESSNCYPGSCLIAAQIMRPQDKAFCY